MVFCLVDLRDFDIDFFTMRTPTAADLHLAWWCDE